MYEPDFVFHRINPNQSVKGEEESIVVLILNKDHAKFARRIKGT